MGPVELDGAKCALAYSIVEGASTKLDAAAAAWESQFAGKKVDFSKWLLAEVAKVTAADMLHAVRKYLVTVFDPVANMVVCCPTSKLDAICAALAERGALLESRSVRLAHS